MIYNLCLITDKVIVPYKEFYPLDRVKDLGFRDDMPTVALLGVSKLVRAEAAEVLYKKNTWRITSEAPFFHKSNDKVDWFWNRRPELFKAVNLVFDQRDIDFEEFRTNSENGHVRLENSSKIARQEFLRLYLHMIAANLMEDQWSLKLNDLSLLPNLDTVTFDVKNLYCWFGCCRADLLDALLSKFGSMDRFKQNQAPKNAVLYIQGIHSKKEKDILKGYGFIRDPKCKARSMERPKTADCWEEKMYLNYTILRQT